MPSESRQECPPHAGRGASPVSLPAAGPSTLRTRAMSSRPVTMSFIFGEQDGHHEARRYAGDGPAQARKIGSKVSEMGVAPVP